MDLVTPDIGLIFWTTVSFAILYFILAKFAWKPLLKALESRENDIQASIEDAEKAKSELENLNQEAEKIIAEFNKTSTEIDKSKSASSKKNKLKSKKISKK